MTSLPVMCPSGRCREGSTLLGIINAQGQAELLAEGLPVDAAFVEIARQGRSPEKRFRFTEPCVQSACRQWDTGGCSIIGRVEAAEAARVPELPACSIRPNCRWHVQRGDAACRVCPFVITDMLDETPPM